MSDRMLRVNSILREVLAEEIERLSDERLEFVTVTGVDTSPDLRHAVVYIDVLRDEQRDEAVAALNKAAPRLRGLVGRQVRMKYTPELRFEMDPGVVSGTRIEQLLRGLGEEE
ncbi:MAG: 30S ribosome-binding factor RbfA [Acidimicrobiales bacterium]|nr:30S ribosome-binding factor RbfA [Acidimicrobiales bacterium]HLV89852.1 30S ribosome-binding factor RbfA [Acidimicrobiia bacterium]